MPTDHRAQVEELLAEYRRSREQLGSIQQELAAIAETATSEDRTVEVTVGSQGVLTDLRLTEEAYRRYRPPELAAVIVRLAGEAARSASERAGAVLEPALPAGTDPAAVLEGRADLDPVRGRPSAAARQAGTSPRAAADDEGEAPGEHSWLEGSITSENAGRLRGARTKRTRS